MDRIPDLSHDSSDVSISFKYIQESSTPVPDEVDEIESSEDEVLNSEEPRGYSVLHGKIYSNEQEFQSELQKLKKHSTQKFKNKWEEILNKYSQINDDLESDEIDLITGEILTDNGHLKSLRSTERSTLGNVIVNGNIWGTDWESDQRSLQYKERKHKDRKEQLKSKLKELQRFHNQPLKRSQEEQKTDMTIQVKPSLEDNIMLLNPSPKKFRSPSKSPIKSDSILDMSPSKRPQSPVSPLRKKSKKEYSMKDANVQGGTSRSLYSKLKEHSSINVNQNNEEYLTDSGGSDSEIDANYEVELISDVEDSEQDLSEEEIDKISVDSERQDKKRKKLIKPSAGKTRGKYNVISLISGKTKKDGELSVRKRAKKFPQLDGTPEVLQQDSSFDEEYSILSDSTQLGIPSNSLSLYHCAFHKCTYCTGNKSMYQSHLLAKHSLELRALNYPIESNPPTIVGNISVSIEEEQKLKEVFPLTFQIPDNTPIVCNRTIDAKKCTKFYFNNEDLQSHRAENRCSHKVQVLVCPVLGCGYMTDGGYNEWRTHFKVHAKQNATKSDRHMSSPIQIHKQIEVAKAIKHEASKRSTQRVVPKPVIVPRKLSENTAVVIDLKLHETAKQDHEEPYNISFEDVGHESIDELFDC